MSDDIKSKFSTSRLVRVYNRTSYHCTLYNNETDALTQVEPKECLTCQDIIVPWLFGLALPGNDKAQGLRVRLSNGQFTYVWEDKGYLSSGPDLGYGEHVQVYSKAGHDRTLIIGERGITIMDKNYTLFTNSADDNIENSQDDEIQFSAWSTDFQDAES